MTPLDVLGWAGAIVVLAIAVGLGIAIIGTAIVEVRKRWR